MMKFFNLLSQGLRNRCGKDSLCVRGLLQIFSTAATTPDKTVETFQCNFQFRAMQSSCPKETNSPPSPPLLQCCFGLTAQVCISFVIANNIAKGEGGNGLLICDGEHFCQGE